MSAPRRPLVEVRELESLRAEVERQAEALAPRWNANPEDVQKSVARLVLTLVEFIRQLLERQAIRRMEGGTLTAEETENVGVALMRLEETVRDMAARFGLAPDELNLDLGPLGRLSSTAQITDLYDPDELVGLQVTVVVNLPPKRVAGLDSQVLVLAIDNGKSEFVLLIPERPVPDGSKVS